MSGSGMLLSGIEVDILDRGDDVLVRANVPGFDEDDISVTAEDDKLVIAAHATPVEGEGGEAAGGESGEDGSGEGDGDDGDGAGERDGPTVLRRERPDRDLQRIVRLPVPVDAERAEASYDRGVLDVALPKVEDTDGTSIEVE